MFEKRPVDPLYELTFRLFQGIMVTFEAPSRTPPRKAPAGHQCWYPFEYVKVQGLKIPTFELLNGTHTMFPEGARTPPLKLAVMRPPEGKTSVKSSVTALNTPMFEAALDTKTTR